MEKRTKPPEVHSMWNTAGITVPVKI